MKYGPPGVDTRSLSPFFIGLLGHRAIRQEELPRIQQEFDYQIGLILKRLKSTRIIVLTSLAEGADRIVQNSKYRDLISVCAVLPFGRKEYEKDFDTPRALTDFKNALADCDYVIICPGENHKNGYRGKARNLGYRNCARWISDHSNLLIVVWDGKKPGKIGGTGDTVEYRLEDIASKPLIYSRSSGLFHIPASNGKSNFQPNCQCMGHSADSAEYLDYLNELEKLNSRIFPSTSNFEDDQLYVYFKQFDKSAVMIQKEFRNQTKVLLTLGVFTLTFAAIQQITFRLEWLLATGGTLLVTLLLWWRLIHNRTKASYETFRFVAEVLRIQIWWNQTGVNRSILHEDIESHDVNDTVYLVLSNVLTFSTIHKLNLHRLQRVKRLPNQEEDGKAWIDDQILYLEGNNRKLGALFRTASIAKQNQRISFFALCFAATVQIFSTVIHMRDPLIYVSLSEIVIKILFSTSLAIAAAFAAFEEVLGNKEISTMYELKLRRLYVASAQLKKAGPDLDNKSVVIHVGADSLAESLRWFQLKSDREIRPFKAT